MQSIRAISLETRAALVVLLSLLLFLLGLGLSQSSALAQARQRAGARRPTATENEILNQRLLQRRAA